MELRAPRPRQGLSCVLFWWGYCPRPRILYFPSHIATVHALWLGSLEHRAGGGKDCAYDSMLKPLTFPVARLGMT